MPQKSQIVLNVSDIHLSHVTGFQDTLITPLPFSAEADNLTMSLFAGFQPHLVLSAAANTNRLEAFEDEFVVSGGTGVFLDLPKLTAEVEMLYNVSSTCNGSAPDGETNTYVQVKPGAIFSFNGEWGLGIDLPFSFLDYNAGGAQNWYESTVLLADYDQCLLWNSESQSTTPQSDKANGSAKVLALSLNKSMVVLISLMALSMQWL